MRIKIYLLTILLLIAPFYLAARPHDFSSIPDGTSQVLITEVNGTSGKLSVFKRDGESWTQVKTIDIVVGRKGIAAPGKKREGDGKTPSGIFHINRAFGYNASGNTDLSYTQVTDNHVWVDDSNSPLYNKMTTFPVQASSFERLKRKDHLYKYALVVEYNTVKTIPGNGSAIFIHVWRRKGSPTAGCIAAKESDLVWLLEFLKMNANPVILIKD